MQQVTSRYSLIGATQCVQVLHSLVSLVGILTNSVNRVVNFAIICSYV